ncbi:hypothetical protein FocTR4_00011704 [Fusarium oxysporum f. sp. cubense]|uniref:BTB domain-containing protein n=2 Tax=Fusarium oxysporum species complex TaxID=171631 RepID=A0A5C6SEN6_FUSOC|nr:hypothetical protein FocTR4_00011704 [Fusarium oxysporum f. sp. cubense]
MEALGAFASVVTIVGLIRPTTKFVRSLRGITSNDGHVAKEIERMASSIQASATSIDVSLKALKGHASTLEKMQRAPSEVLQYIIDNKSIDIIVSGTESIRKQMRDTSRDLDDTNNRSEILRKINWLLLDKMEVESLFPEMQVVASCLNLVCPIIGLEINRYLLNKSSGEVAECLKQEIAPADRRSPVPEETYLSLAPSNTPQPSPGSRRQKPHSVPVPREAPSEVTRHTSSSPESSRPHSAVPSSSPKTSDTPPTPQSPDAPKSLRIDTSTRAGGSRGGIVRTIQGHIINHGKEIPVKNATIDQHGSFNYISVKTANQLDLDIQELDPDEPSHTHSGSHEMILPGKVIGKVTGVGWRRAGRAKIIPVEFLVKDSYCAVVVTPQHFFSHLSTTYLQSSPQRSAATMALQSTQSKALVDLLKTGDYSDLVISCGKDQYSVHKAIICPRSHFFKAACDGKFKEAQTGTIDLPDDDPVAVRMMIEYLYHDTYAPAGASIHRDGAIDAHLSDTEYDDEKEKRKRELYGATFIGNKRIKRLTALPEDSTVRASQPARFTGFAAFIASRESQRGSDRNRQEHGSSTSTNSVSVQSPSQASPNQSSSPPRPSPAPSPTPHPPRPSAPQRPIPPANLHLHAKVYALGEKYGIQPLKALALRKFESEAQFHLHSDDFLQGIREAYTSTVETDRPLRDAVVTILRSNKGLLKKESVKEVLKETGLGFDLLMDFASR